MGRTRWTDRAPGLPPGSIGNVIDVLSHDHRTVKRSFSDGPAVGRHAWILAGLWAAIAGPAGCLAAGSQLTRRPQSSHMTAYFFTPAGVTAIWRRTGR